MKKIYFVDEAWFNSNLLLLKKYDEYLLNFEFKESDKILSQILKQLNEFKFYKLRDSISDDLEEKLKAKSVKDYFLYNQTHLSKEDSKTLLKNIKIADEKIYQKFIELNSDADNADKCIIILSE